MRTRTLLMPLLCPGLGLLLACAAPSYAGSAAAAPASARPEAGLAARLLALHNRERKLVGAPPLAWSERLAADAAAYAARLGALGRLEHSPKTARPGVGENLAMGTAGDYTAEHFVGSWIGEKARFANGVFGQDPSKDWNAVSHYTAIVWRATTEVGCGTFRGGGHLYLVCRYSPRGNVSGERVY